MRFAKKLASGLLIGFGSLFIIAGISAPFDAKNPPAERVNAFWGCMMLGLPLTVGGVWLAGNLHHQTQQERSDRLQAIFFQSLKESDGLISVLQFSMATKLPGKEAKQYLDEKAKEFSANFEVDEQGGIFYRFPVALPEES